MQPATHAPGRDTAGTPLVTALRESCGYLRDADYHQTAQLMTVAADEIERLNRALRAVEAQPATARAKAAGAIARVRSLAATTMNLRHWN